MASTLRQTVVSYKDYRDYNWKEGEIAFLKHHDEFSKEDYDSLIKPDRLQKGATNHPVIILKRCSPSASHVLVTPVSAYGSGPDNDFLPPWKQKRHCFRAIDDFRAFLGSELPMNPRPQLLLEAGSMPKPRASWVYIQNVYLVPIRTLKFFDKTNRVLRMEQDSLTDLRQHTSANNVIARRLFDDARLKLKISKPINNHPGFREQNWRTPSHNNNSRFAPSTTSDIKSSRPPSLATPLTSVLITSPRSTPRIPAPSFIAQNITTLKPSVLAPAKPVSWAVACA